MRQVIAFAIAAVAAMAAGCTNDTGVTCPPGQTLCGDVCVYTTSDPKNCGTCGNVCMGDLECIGGVCGCPSGQTACGTTCTNIKSDVSNCGACGTVCPSPEVCSMSACTGSCASGLTSCNRDCVNLQTDDQNCGMCGTACASGLHCVGGTCMQECPNGQVACGGKCVSLLSDSGNCGTCGNACPNDYFCIFGSCILGCPQPLTRCVPDGGESDGGSQCVDTRFDPGNCGGCGGSEASPSPSPNQASLFLPHVCTATPGFNDDPVCDNGACAWVCAVGMLDCEDDFGGKGPANKPLFSSNRSRAPKRSFGRLAPPTPPGGLPGEEACVDPRSDNCNCGGCGNNDDEYDTDFPNGVCGWDDDPPSTDLCCNSQFVTIGTNDSCGSCAAQTVCPSNAPTCCPTNYDENTNISTTFACDDTNADFHNCGGCALIGDGQDCSMVPLPPGGGTVTCCGENGGCQVLDSVTSCGTCPSPTDCTFGGEIPVPSVACCPQPSGPPGTNGCEFVTFNDSFCGPSCTDCTTMICPLGGTSHCQNGTCTCVTPE